MCTLLLLRFQLMFNRRILFILFNAFVEQHPTPLYQAVIQFRFDHVSSELPRIPSQGVLGGAQGEDGARRRDRDRGRLA